MARKSRSYSNKKVWILLLVVFAAVILVVLKSLGAFKSNDQKAQEQTQTYNNSRKEAAIDNNGSTSSNGTKDSTPTTPYAPPINNDGITITPSTSDSNVVITTKLVGYSDGTCKLDVTNGIKTTSQTVAVIYAPNYSTCAGFTIPKDTLGTGEWDITLTIISGGNTTSKTATYEVGS